MSSQFQIEKVDESHFCFDKAKFDGETERKGVRFSMKLNITNTENC